MAQFDPLSFVPRAQQLAKTGVEGFGQAAAPYLNRRIGTALGDLNSIGALRSGQVNTTLGDIATDYGNEVGGYAKQAAGESLGAGLSAGEMALQKSEMDRKRKASLLGSIGGLLGTGLGFAGAGGVFGPGIQKAFGGG